MVLIVEGCGRWWLKVLGIDEVDVGLVPLVTGSFRGLHTHLAKKAFGVAWWIDLWMWGETGWEMGVRQDGR